MPKTFVARIWALGVKPAFEDVDADCFLAFQSAWLKTESSPMLCMARSAK